MDKEEIVIKKLIDKANKAYQINYQVHSDFLNLHEQSLLYSYRHELPNIAYTLMGGFKESERKCAIFHPFEWGTENLDEPYSVIKIEPLGTSSLSQLNHRDYLGAILNLSIKREVIGDILIKEGIAFVCCMDNMTDFILNNLSMVKNQSVTMKRVGQGEYQSITLDYRVLSNTVASNRIDSILKVCLSLSRTKVVELIKAKKVFINSQVTLNASAKILAGTVISVRGFGKYRLNKIGAETKKGRFHVEIYQYI